MARREESAPEHWLRNIRVSGFAVMMLGLLVLAIVVLAPNLKIFIEQRQQIAALEAEVARDQAAVDQLDQDLARWEDPAYIVAEARDRLFFMYPGESTYLVIDDTGATLPVEQAPITDQLVTTRVDWVRAVLSSVFSAGLTEATPDQLPAPAGG
jgi:cell division protein FtsB